MQEQNKSDASGSATLLPLGASGWESTRDELSFLKIAQPKGEILGRGGLKRLRGCEGREELGRKKKKTEDAGDEQTTIFFFFFMVSYGTLFVDHPSPDSRPLGLLGIR